MFLEKELNINTKIGWIEVVCGSMFSGKTEELIRRVKRAKIAKQKVIIFKPTIDTRYSDTNIVSHNQNEINSIAITKSMEILSLVSGMEVVGIDEVQFFDKDIVKVCSTLANSGIRIIVAGLDMDFKGMPFGEMPKLMAISEYVTKVHAICVKCGNIANYTHRTSKSKVLVELGETDKYEALCRHCYNNAN